MDLLSAASLDFLDRLGAVTAFIVICILVITDRLVWHTRLKASDARAERWENAALEALKGAQAGVKAAEVAVGVVSAIPDPQGDRDRAQAARDGVIGP